MTRFISVFLLLLASVGFVYTEVQAQALQLAKPFTGKVNKAVASTLGKRLNTMGFAANDPIYANTLLAAETVVTGAVAAGSVAATVAAIGSSPVWLSVALGIGAAYEIYDFTMGPSWQFHADSATHKVQVAAGTVVIAPPLPTPQPIGTWIDIPAQLPPDYTDPGIGAAVRYPSDLPICANFTMSGPTAVMPTPPGINVAGTVCGISTASIAEQVEQFYLNYVARVSQQIYVATFTNTYFTTGYTYYYSLTSFVESGASGPTKTTCSISPLICPEGTVYAFGKNHSGSYSRRAVSPTGTQVITNGNFTGTYQYSVFNNPQYSDPARAYSLNDGAAKLTNPDLAALADPELLAAIANRIWQQAAQQPGYSGAPYDTNNPVTAQDILSDVASGLYPHPTVQDLLSLPSPTAGTAVALDPASVPVAAPSGDTVTVDLGVDPGIASPGLEDAPTGSSIVTYVMGLMPSFSAFTIPAHTSECVMPSFDFFGHAMSMAGACDLIEQQRATLSILFSAIWGISGLVTVLRA